MSVKIFWYLFRKKQSLTLGRYFSTRCHTSDKIKINQVSDLAVFFDQQLYSTSCHVQRKGFRREVVHRFLSSRPIIQTNVWIAIAVLVAPVCLHYKQFSIILFLYLSIPPTHVPPPSHFPFLKGEKVNCFHASTDLLSATPLQKFDPD